MWTWVENISNIRSVIRAHFTNAKATHGFFFSKNISGYAIFNDQSFKDTLTNAIVSFEQLGPDLSFDFIY